MTQDISSLMDGELEARDADRTIRSCCASEEQKDTWYLYHAIGDAIRGQAPRTLDRAGGIARALESQPTVLAPKARRVMETTFGRVAFAAVASLATVGVVSWIGMQGGAPTASAPVVAKGTPAASIQPAAATGAVSTPPPDVQDYLAAHRQIPSPESYRAVANRGAAAKR